MRYLTLALSLFLCVSQFSRADEASAIAEIEKLGGVVRQIAQDADDKEAAFHLSGKELTDEGLVHLREIKNLIWLNLANTKISDAGLKHIADMKSLKRLHLEKTQIGDEGLAHIKGLSELEYLNLYGTQVSDAGLDHLKPLTKLQKLFLWESKATKEGAAKLKDALAKADINTGAELKPPPPPVMTTGQYVRVRLEGDKRILQLAELQVLGVDGTEFQKSATARQSSTYTGGEAKKAIDGNAEQDFTKGSVSHTEEQKNPWFVVDLGEPKEIAIIKIHNRGDCCGDRLKDAVVEVLDAGLNVVATKKVSDAKDGSVSEFPEPK